MWYDYDTQVSVYVLDLRFFLVFFFLFMYYITTIMNQLIKAE